MALTLADELLPVFDVSDELGHLRGCRRPWRRADRGRLARARASPVRLAGSVSCAVIAHVKRAVLVGLTHAAPGEGPGPSE
jgi:hypothetical protein